ncbi:MAG: zf-HC2 domain-containing protein [Acidobacteria bacterium]|nr:zf-HC2 domain-containing protein [Acidobacteriota bacterium]
MSDVTCARGVELLMDYLEGVLSAGVMESIDRHVGGCPRCLAFIASYRETPALLRDATAEEIPGDTKRRLDGFVRSLSERPRES